MQQPEFLAERFEENRSHLRAVAYRMLGSASEADDAVQEAWLRLSRSDTSVVENLGGWLTTVIARVCLDMLRSRSSRREESIDDALPEPVAHNPSVIDPEQEAVLADSVGLALLVVLNRLAPAERLAFVLHDMFAVPFEEIATIIGHSPASARQLASRARKRVQGTDKISPAERTQRRDVVNAFLTALRAGDFEGLLAVLDPDVQVHIDEFAGRPGAPREIRGAANWAKGAIAFAQAAGPVQAALVDGEAGVVLATGGRLSRAVRFTLRDGKIVEVEIIGDPARLNRLELAILGD